MIFQINYNLSYFCILCYGKSKNGVKKFSLQYKIILIHYLNLALIQVRFFFWGRRGGLNFFGLVIHSNPGALKTKEHGERKDERFADGTLKLPISSQNNMSTQPFNLESSPGKSLLPKAWFEGCYPTPTFFGGLQIFK